MQNGLANLFIVGVQKGGTTALHSILTRHPEIRGGRVKELHIFDGSGPDSREADLAAFAASFSDTDRIARYRLDATPITCFWPGAAERMQRYNPEARVILLLRHPAYRAYSHWRMTTVRKIETLPFAEALRREDRRHWDEPAHLPSRHFSYLSRGCYAAQIETLRRFFPSRSIHVLRTDEVFRQPETVLTRLCTWLGLAPDPILSRPAGYIVPLNGLSLPDPDPKLMALLSRWYAPDIRRTASLTGLDLSDWLSPAYIEPMTA